MGVFLSQGESAGPTMAPGGGSGPWASLWGSTSAWGGREEGGGGARGQGRHLGLLAAESACD